VVETCGRRTLTLAELHGLDVLTTPAWVFHQKRREVPWANVEAMRTYFRRSSADRDRSPSASGHQPASHQGNAQHQQQQEHHHHEKDPEANDTVRFYAMVEDEGCTVHIVGPRRVLLAGVRPDPRKASSVRRVASTLLDNENEVVTLVVSPIEIVGEQGGSRTAALFHEITLSDLRFDHALDIQADDTPIDVIVKMLDEIISGFPVPSVHAKFVRDLLREGADVHQPVIFAKSFVMSADGLSRRKRIQDMMGIPSSDGSASTSPRLSPADAIETHRAGPQARRSSALSNNSSTNNKEDDLPVLVADLGAPSFDGFALEERVGGRLLSKTAMALLDDARVVEQLDLDRAKLVRFVRTIEDGYRKDNLYHNAVHAASVLQSVHRILEAGHIIDAIAGDDPRAAAMARLVAYVAAVVHDYRHTGCTNKFLVDVASPTAIVYNDLSPQENMHSASAFKVLLDDRHNFMVGGFDMQESRTFRNQVMSMVLHTDMQQHFPLITRFKTRMSAMTCMSAMGAMGQAGHSARRWLRDEADATLVLQMVLKVADMSHLTYDFDLHRSWVERLQEEMFRQGDDELALGLPPSALCDRTKPGITSSQSDFIDFVATGMFAAFVRTFPYPEIDDMCRRLSDNRARWATMQCGVVVTREEE
jgi:cAMP-specific phosphodiesterase 4/high affinity cAMP-specific and IBMX-insensitive 3',5'-cyclic phosphodiesterase 8